MDHKKNFIFNIITIIVSISAITFSAYALWRLNQSQKKWGEMDNAIATTQLRIDKLETHLLNMELTNFINITSARLSLNLNRQFVFYGLVNQPPLTHDVIISLYTRDDFFKTEDPELKKFIINLVKQHTETVLQTVKVTSGITGTKVDHLTINFLDNTDSKNILAQYKNKKLRVKINNTFTPVSIQK
ncbi:MAG: hypothetical protein Q8O60_01405 [Deltaproteobacteria bacterium]|nr:hypothetical protein [Deltaproteobacteria bacterium]MDP2992212.1 hypothetical protein [Deltaproteobacteria bacterium]MDP3029943.1 hypothetical protein [Deltaproteobacteria bacterium]